MNAEWARKSILATVDEIRTGQRILGIPSHPDELAEVQAIIARIEEVMRRAAEPVSPASHTSD